MAKRQPKSPEVHFFLALHFLREHQPAKALSAFEAAAAAVAALPEERMSQPRRDLHSAAHRHMAQADMNGLDGLLGLAGLEVEEVEGREAKRVCSALDMFAAVADLELRREERLRQEEACKLRQDSAEQDGGVEGGVGWGGAFVAEGNVGEERVPMMEEERSEAVEEEEAEGDEEEEKEQEEDVHVGHEAASVLSSSHLLAFPFPLIVVTGEEGAELAPAATGTAGADASIEGGDGTAAVSAAAGDLAGVSAQQCATAAVQLLPSCAFLWCNLAHAATRTGSWKQAAKCMSQALKLQPSSAPLRFAAAAHRIATAAAAPMPLALASQHMGCGVAEMADAAGLPGLAHGSNDIPYVSRDGASAIIFGTGAAAAAAGGGTYGAGAGAFGAVGGGHGGNRKCMLGHVPEWMAWDAVAHAHATLERRALQEIVTKTGAFVVKEEAAVTVTGCAGEGSVQAEEDGMREEGELEAEGRGKGLLAMLGAAARGEGGTGEEHEEGRCKEEEEAGGSGSGQEVNEELACAVVQAEELKLAAWKRQSLMAAEGLGTGAHQLGVHALHSAIHSLGSDMGGASAMRDAAHMGDGTAMGGAAAGMGDAELSSTGHFSAARSHFLRALSRHQQSAATWTSLGLCLQLSGRLDESEAAYTRALQCPSSLPPHHSTDPSASPPPPSPPPPLASAPHVTWCNLSLLLRAQGRLSAALSAAHNALLLAPAHGPSLCSFALLSAAAGRWNDAVDAFQRASEALGGVQKGVERGEVVGEGGGVMEGRGDVGEECGFGVGEVVGVGEAVRDAVRVNLQVALKWQARAEEERQKVERKRQEREERERRKAERVARKEAKRVRKQERLERRAKKEHDRRERAEKRDARKVRREQRRNEQEALLRSKQEQQKLQPAAHSERLNFLGASPAAAPAAAPVAVSPPAASAASTAAAGAAASSPAAAAGTAAVPKAALMDLNEMCDDEADASSLGATPAEAAAHGAENPRNDDGAAAAPLGPPPGQQGAAVGVAVRGESGGAKVASQSKDYQSLTHNVAASGFSWEVFKLPRPVTLPSNGATLPAAAAAMPPFNSGPNGLQQQQQLPQPWQQQLQQPRQPWHGRQHFQQQQHQQQQQQHQQQQQEAHRSSQALGGMQQLSHVVLEAEKRKRDPNGTPQILGSAVDASKGKEAEKAASGSGMG
ncbi:unnamed protein product [Closterium sp. Naga37s-1]|nr:unnamed protein product [Closterium sp. Naga37s-1]